MRHTIIKRTNQKKKRLLIAAATIIILLMGVTLLEVTNTTYLFHERKAVSSTIAAPTSTDNKKSDTQSDEKTSAPSVPTTPETTPPKPATTPASGSPKEADTPSSTTNAPLIEPYGDFVSNHSPGKNGAPTAVTSVCNTTPGAKCSITFTSAANPSIVKTLAAGTADASGSVFWNNWDVEAAGFTNGIWQIKAIATLNGKTLTTPDKTNFEVVL